MVVMKGWRLVGKAFDLGYARNTAVCQGRVIADGSAGAMADEHEGLDPDLALQRVHGGPEIRNHALNVRASIQACVAVTKARQVKAQARMAFAGQTARQAHVEARSTDPVERAGVHKYDPRHAWERVRGKGQDSQQAGVRSEPNCLLGPGHWLVRNEVMRVR